MKKKTKDRSTSKPKETAPASSDLGTSAARSSRGRGGTDGTRGGRGRGSDRARGSSRGGRGNHNATNGARHTKADAVPMSDSSVAVTQSPGWDSSVQADNTSLDASWENVTAEAAQAIAEVSKPSSKPDGTRSWASMFAKPKPAPAPPKVPATTSPEITSTPASKPDDDLPGLPPPVAVNEISEVPNTPPESEPNSSDVPNLTPPADELTETNLEQVPDASGPPATATAVSTTASTMDPRNAGTPLPPFQGKGNPRPPMGGFATTAWKAATGGRSASFQRKIHEQEESVVMPSKHAVDRAAVQFGSMGLGATSEDVDVDSDREDAETRAQPPQHSPVAPRASLPPAPQQTPFAPQAPSIETQSTPRQAPGLPPVTNTTASQQDQPLSAAESLVNPSNYGYNQFTDRYGTQGPSQTQKSYEPFGQQPQPPQTDTYPSSSQPQQSQPQAPISSAGNDMTSFYTTDNQRNTYQNNIYGNYQSQEPGNAQPRTGSAFGTSASQPGAQYATSHNPPGRFNQAGEAQNSGHSTPNPSLPVNQPHHMPQGQPGGQHGGYPYQSYPYNAGYSSYYVNHMGGNTHLYGRDRLPFDDVRRYDDQYISQNHQYQYNGSQAGYGGGMFGGKQGAFGQAHQGYGMSPQTSYDQQSASPANTGAFGSQLPSTGRESAATGGLTNYGRSGSTQPSENPPQQFPGTATSGGHTNVSDVFGRSQSGFQGHGHGVGAGSNEESLRGYNDNSKGPGGPSPALGQPGGRPGSAANPQGQGGYSGYPSHMNQQMHGQQGSQYGGAPGHQSGSQNQGYGGYGGYGGNYYGSSNRGGWAANYGH